MSGSNRHSSKAWKQTRHDKFWQLAKEQGYRSRAAFKLIQLNKKYNFLASCKAVIDLGAAPGGWLQVCAKFMPVSSLIIGVDLVPIKPIPHVITLQEDITSQKCRVSLKKSLQSWNVDCVMHDGAPNVGGSTWSRDAYQQNELVVHSLKLATEFLRPGGMFISKIFRSQDYNSLVWVLNQLFTKVEITKPAASRNASAEIFAVCQGFKAPKRIDPKFLDPAHIFKTTEENKQNKDVFQAKAGKRNRSGYDDEAGQILFKSATVTQFLDAEEPGVFLGTFNAITFDKSNDPFEAHDATTAEVKALCADLKVLNQGDFRGLLKWRRKLREYRAELLREKRKEEEKPEEVPLTAEEKQEKQEAELDENLQEARKRADARKKKEERRDRERKRKQRRKLALNKDSNSDIIDKPEDQGLFTLGQIPDEDSLDRLHNHGDAGDGSLIENALDELEREEFGPAETGPHDHDDKGDDADDDVDSLDRMAADLDAQYREYKKRRNITDKKKRAKLGITDGESTEDVLGDFKPALNDDEDELAAGKKNPLLVKMGETEESGKTKADRWFSSDAFKDILPGNAESTVVRSTKKRKTPDMSESSDEDEPQSKPSRASKKSEKATKSNGVRSSSVASAASSRPDEQPTPAKAADDDDDDDAEATAKDNFEEVPMEDYSSDSDAMAERMAMGVKMLRKKSREGMINDAYNRYAWNDDELPEWFVTEELKHNVKQMPVTKEEVDAFKEKLKEINARPMKKIAEARARKKMRAVQRWEKVKQKADQIVANEDMNQNQKLQNIEKLYRQGKVGMKEKVKKKELKLIVAKKGGGSIASGSKAKGARVKHVDKRLKKDLRGQKSSAKKQAGRSKQKNIKRQKSKSSKGSKK